MDSLLRLTTCQNLKIVKNLSLLSSSGAKRAMDYEQMVPMDEEINQKPHLSFIQIASPMYVPTDTSMRAYARPGSTYKANSGLKQ